MIQSINIKGNQTFIIVFEGIPIIYPQPLSTVEFAKVEAVSMGQAIYKAKCLLTTNNSFCSLYSGIVRSINIIY
jgi:hypothetical protein